MWANARAPPPASTRPRLRPASRSARSDTASRRSPSATVSRHASVAATQATRSAGAGRRPMTTRSGWKPSAGTLVGYAAARLAPPGRRRPTAAGRSPARRGRRRPRRRRPRAGPDRPPPRPGRDPRRRRFPGRRPRGAWPAAPSGGGRLPGCRCPRAGRPRRSRAAAPHAAVAPGGRGAHLAGHLGEHGPGRRGSRSSSPSNADAWHLDQRRVPACPHAGGPRLAREQRELAHDGTRRQGPEQHASLDDLEPPAAQQVRRPWRRRPRGTATRRRPG